MVIKRVFKIFMISDFEKEEKYLRAMHQKGWKFLKVDFCLFYFEKVEPSDVIYQLDFVENRRKRDSDYYQIFLDSGWQHVDNCQNFSYFRRPALTCIDENDRSIYSDKVSKVEMINRIIKLRLGVLIPLWLVSFLNMFKSSFFLSLSIILSILIIYVASGFYRLKKKYR